MELLELKTNIRTARGNGPSRSLRREGRIPAVLYGPGADNVMLTVGMKDLEKVLKARSAGQLLFNLTVENGEKSTRIAMLKELQTHPVTRNYIHADFYQVNMDRKIRVNVPVRTRGKCIGVEMGGMIQIIRRTLEVICYPKDIPQTVELDVTNLNVGESVHIKDISIEGLEFPAEVNFTVLTILGAGRGKEESAEAAEEAEEGKESKKEGKKEE
ncbi:MAG: 50S ribosomal protein L25 [Desulfobacterales bacterium]